MKLSIISLGNEGQLDLNGNTVGGFQSMAKQDISQWKRRYVGYARLQFADEIFEGIILNKNCFVCSQGSILQRS